VALAVGLVVNRALFVHFGELLAVGIGGIAAFSSPSGGSLLSPLPDLISCVHFKFYGHGQYPFAGILSKEPLVFLLFPPAVLSHMRIPDFELF
jgi:hypothetical protein